MKKTKYQLYWSDMHVLVSGFCSPLWDCVLAGARSTDRQTDRYLLVDTNINQTAYKNKPTQLSVVRLYRLKIIAKYSKNYEKLQNTRKNKTVSA